MNWTNYLHIFIEPWWCVACLGLFLCIVILYSGNTRSAFPKKKKKTAEEHPMQPVSIVLCARNEHERLSKLLPLLLEQEYEAPFEVIVVDKNSEDDTDILLPPLAHKYPNLVVRKLNADLKFGQDSSMALGVGIRAATMHYVILLRPDVMPDSKLWLQSFMSDFPQKESTQIMLGHVTFRLCHRTVRADLLEQDLHYFSTARKGLAYMGNGTPVVFQRKLFFDHHGFDSRITDKHLYLEALLGHIITSDNTTVCTNPQATLKTVRRIHSNEWNLLRHRQIHTLSLVKGWRYALLTAHKTCIGAFYVCWIITLALLLRSGFSLDLLPSLIALASMILLRWCQLGIYYYGYQKSMHETRLWFHAPVWDICSPVVHWFFLLSGLIRKK